MDIDSEVPPSRPRLPWFWIVLAVGAGLLVLRLSASGPLAPSARNAGGAHPGVGKRLTSLSLRPLTFAGDPLTLDDLAGKVVVLNFWGTWCPPCRDELPHVAELAEHYRNDDRCRVLAVSCGSGGPDPVSDLPELHMNTQQLLESMHLELPSYADPDGRTRRAVAQAVGFDGYPTTLVVDAQGVVRGIWTGYGPGVEKEIATLVATLLGG
ncbi:MAG: hypothetical protein B7Z73_09055 [Planctomycetia bacterium 21-64-5]|nr:MAG: hypothetical protein B7Z73_09055 [Planctomycetia bacterium 21-64-5]HQU42070.1 TlpA disulfide reductase family protein [Pirellulales bacterium]